jgi:hypothetical protein
LHQTRPRLSQATVWRSMAATLRKTSTLVRLDLAGIEIASILTTHRRQAFSLSNASC